MYYFRFVICFNHCHVLFSHLCPWRMSNGDVIPIGQRFQLGVTDVLVLVLLLQDGDRLGGAGTTAIG